MRSNSRDARRSGKDSVANYQLILGPRMTRAPEPKAIYVVSIESVGEYFQAARRMGNNSATNARGEFWSYRLQLVSYLMVNSPPRRIAHGSAV